MANVPRRIGLAVAVMGLLGGVASRAKADIVVVVTPGNPAGWSPLVTDGNGVPGGNPTGNVQFVTGPSTPPLGVGSVNLSTGDGTIGGDGSAQLRNSDYAGTRLDSLTALSYSTYDTANNGSQFPYLNLTISKTGMGPADDRLYFEPPYQTPASGNPSLPNQGNPQMNAWQTWNALSGGWYSLSGVGGPGTAVVSLATYLVAYPNATLENAVSGLGGIRLNVGFGSSNDVFNGNVDAFKIGINGTNTTYDFEPGVGAAAVPEPGSIVMTGIAGLLGLGYAWRRRERTA